MNPAENWQPPHFETSAAAPAAPVTPVNTAPAPANAPGLGPKVPIVAAVLSLMPGMGHVYNGLYMRGVTFFLIAASLIALADKRGDVFGFAIAFFWIFNILDSWRQATLINYGYAQDLGLADLPRHPRASQGGLLAGVLLTLIGLFSLLDQYFVIDLDWLFDFWPVGLMAIGLWIIWSSIRARRGASAA
jgi:hypothetical protein